MKLPAIVLLMMGLCIDPAFAEQDLAPALPTDGYVYHNMPLNHVQQGFKIKYLANKRKYLLVSRNEPAISAYRAWVPAGDYQLSTFNDHELICSTYR